MYWLLNLRAKGPLGKGVRRVTVPPHTKKQKTKNHKKQKTVQPRDQDIWSICWVSVQKMLENVKQNMVFIVAKPRDHYKSIGH